MGAFTDWLKKREENRERARKSGKRLEPEVYRATGEKTGERTPGARARRRVAKISRASRKVNRRKARGMSVRGKVRL